MIIFVVFLSGCGFSKLLSNGLDEQTEIGTKENVIVTDNVLEKETFRDIYELIEKKCKGGERIERLTKSEKVVYFNEYMSLTFPIISL